MADDVKNRAVLESEAMFFTFLMKELTYFLIMKRSTPKHKFEDLLIPNNKTPVQQSTEHKQDPERHWSFYTKTTKSFFLDAALETEGMWLTEMKKHRSI